MKKVLCLILCVVLFTVSFSTISLAVYEESLIITDVIEDSWIVDVKGENLSEISDSANKKYYLQGQEYALHYDAYSQLDQAQKVMYDAIVANTGKLSFTINFDNGVYASSNFTKEYLTNVMMAVCTDRPDIFYYAGYSIGGGYYYSGNKYIKSLDYNCSVYDSSYYTLTNLPGYYNALMSKVNTLASSGTFDISNRYNFIKSVHDYLADTVYYPDLNSTDYVMSAHDAYGALIEGRAVCQGYSDAVKLICDYYGIPCVCISGTSDGVGHMWNAVQMEDGKWYLVDLTWDDQTNKTYYDFFLVGTESTNTYFGGKKFSDEHVNDADLCLPNLQYATTAYNRNQDHNTLFKGTYNSYFNESNSFLLLSVFDYLKTPVFYNGMNTNVTPYQGYNFTVKDSNGTTKSVTSVIVGDPDGDDLLTDEDYDIAVDCLLSRDNDADDIESAACDVNCDGVVDALDLALLNMGKSGVKTYFELG